MVVGNFLFHTSSSHDNGIGNNSPLVTHFSLLVHFFIRFPNFHLKIMIYIYNTLVFVVALRRFSKWYTYPNFTNILYLSTNLYSSLSYCGCDQVTNFQSAGSNLTNDTLWQEGVLTVLLLSRTLTSKAFEVAKYRFAAKCKVSKYRPCCIALLIAIVCLGFRPLIGL